MRKLVLLVLAVAVICIAVGLYVYQATTTTDEITQLTWEKTGGIAGLSEILVVEANGTASYHSNRFGDAKIILTDAEVKELMNKAENLFAENKMYRPKLGVADYFTYQLTLYTASASTKVTWVDEWASEEAIPKELSDFQSYIENIVLIRLTK